MSTTVKNELLWMFDEDGEDDPELEERDEQIVSVLLAKHPPSKERLIKKEVEKGIEQGRLVEARAALRRVLARRQLALGPEDEARIEACVDLAVLERWLDQAVTAASVSEALQQYIVP